MGKWLIAVIAISVITISGLAWYCLGLKSDLKEKTIALETANETIRIKDIKIRTDGEILDTLKKDNAALLAERNKLDQVLSDLMQKPENKEWGCANIPDDIAGFIYGLECQR